MKKSIRALIIAVLVLCLLCGAYVIADRWKPKESKKDETEPQAAKTVYIIEEKTENIASVDIADGDTRYTLVNGEKVSIDGYSSAVLSQGKLDSALSAYSMISASRKIKEGDNSLADYGLDNPSRSVTVHLKDGSTKTILFGASAAIDNEIYVSEKESGAIYTLSSYSADSLMPSPESFRDLTVCTIDNTSVKAFSIKKGSAEVLRIEKSEEEKDKDDPSAQIQDYNMTYPYAVKASSDKVSALLEKLGAITATDIAEENPADLSKYGLQSPYVITVTDGEGEHVIKLGSKNGSDVYMMSGSLPVVYSAPCDFYDIVTSAAASDYVDRFIHIFNIDTIKEIEFTEGGETHKLSVKGDTSKEGKCDYKLDGKKLDESTFKKLYQSIIGITFTDTAEASPSGSPTATVKFKFKNKKEKTFSYYTIDERYSFAVSDSGLGCKTLTKNLTAVTDAINEAAK